MLVITYISPIDPMAFTIAVPSLINKIPPNFTDLWVLTADRCVTTMRRFGVIRHDQSTFQVSHEKKPPTFHYTGWLIGILIMVYYNPCIINILNNHKSPILCSSSIIFHAFELIPSLMVPQEPFALPAIFGTCLIHHLWVFGTSNNMTDQRVVALQRIRAKGDWMLNMTY